MDRIDTLRNRTILHGLTAFLLLLVMNTGFSGATESSDCRNELVIYSGEGRAERLEHISPVPGQGKDGAKALKLMPDRSGSLRCSFRSHRHLLGGRSGGTSLRYEQGRWARVPTPCDVTLRGVWSGPGDTAWAVGDRGTILRWNENHWEKQDSGTQRDLHGIAGTSVSNLWAVGRQGTALIEPYSNRRFVRPLDHEHVSPGQSRHAVFHHSLPKTPLYRGETLGALPDSRGGTKEYPR